MTDTNNHLPQSVAASVQLYLEITGDTPEEFQLSLKEMAADAAKDRFNQIVSNERQSERPQRPAKP